MSELVENQYYRGGGVIFYEPFEIYSYLCNYHRTHTSYLSILNRSIVDVYIMYYSFDINMKKIAEVTKIDRKTVSRRLNQGFIWSKNNKSWFVNEVDKALDYILYNAKIIYSASKR